MVCVSGQAGSLGDTMKKMTIEDHQSTNVQSATMILKSTVLF